VKTLTLTDARTARPVEFKSREILFLGNCRLDSQLVVCVHDVHQPSEHHFVAETLREAVYAWALAAGLVSPRLTFNPFESAVTLPETPLVGRRGDSSNSSRRAGLDARGGLARGTVRRRVTAGEPNAAA